MLAHQGCHWLAQSRGLPPPFLAHSQTRLAYHKRITCHTDMRAYLNLPSSQSKCCCADEGLLSADDIGQATPQGRLMAARRAGLPNDHWVAVSTQRAVRIPSASKLCTQSTRDAVGCLHCASLYNLGLMESGAKQQLAKITLPDGTETQLPILQVCSPRVSQQDTYKARHRTDRTKNASTCRMRLAQNL